ncbi:MAG: hypothetical protein WBR26_06885 [Candidatus Acidiferrum sp.]
MTADEQDLKAIAQRLEKIEKQNRTLKRFGLAILSLVGAIVTMGQAQASRSIVASEFRLMDSSGTVRATLGFHGGEPTLNLIDANGRARANLTTEAIEFADSNGTTRVVLGSSTAIYYKLVEGQPHITDHGPALLFSGADHKTRVDLRGMSEGASISLFSQGPANLDKQVVLESSPDGPSLTLSDAQGFRAIVGKASLSTPSTGATGKTSAASVVLFDKDGKSIWSAP